MRPAGRRRSRTAPLLARNPDTVNGLRFRRSKPTVFLVTPMLRLASALLWIAVVAVAPARGGDGTAAGKPAPNGRPGPHVDAYVPVDPQSHEDVYWFDGRAHHVAPGTVTINRPGYVCDRDHQTFSRREDFVEHLRRRHKVPPEHLADSLATVDGQVHFRNE